MQEASLKKLFVDRRVAETQEAVSIQARLDIPAAIVDDAREVYRFVSASDDPVRTGKTVLFLTRNQGAFIKRCPGTRRYNCCGYHILHIGTFCTMDCAYCILQAYFHPPILQYFINRRDMWMELQSLFQDKRIRRVGTGEFTDSLIWEQWTDLSARLVSTFARQASAVLELKTKTTAVSGLCELRHNRKTIVAWSLNTPYVIESQERGTASLDDRLTAAALCAFRGYPIAFHFDPMIIYEGCESDYCDVVVRMISAVSPENIVWISLGSFRFMPGLKSIIQKRFPESKVVYGEFVPGRDGKMRYFKPLRLALYQRIVATIRELAPRVLIYFCMEDDEVWEKSLGFVPLQHGGLPHLLDERAVEICELRP